MTSERDRREMERILLAHAERFGNLGASMSGAASAFDRLGQAWARDGFYRAADEAADRKRNRPSKVDLELWKRIRDFYDHLHREMTSLRRPLKDFAYLRECVALYHFTRIYAAAHAAGMQAAAGPVWLDRCPYCRTYSAAAASCGCAEFVGKYGTPTTADRAAIDEIIADGSANA